MSSSSTVRVTVLSTVGVRLSRRHAGYLRPIAREHLNTILELLLNYLISLSLSHDAAPVDDLVSALADEHDVPRDVSNQVMSWFGQVEAGTWKMHVDAVVAEIGLGILRHYKVPFRVALASSPAEHRVESTSPYGRQSSWPNGRTPSATRSSRPSRSNCSRYVPSRWGPTGTYGVPGQLPQTPQ